MRYEAYEFVCTERKGGVGMKEKNEESVKQVDELKFLIEGH